MSTYTWPAKCTSTAALPPSTPNVQRFRGGLVFKAHRLCASLSSRLESNKEKEDTPVLVHNAAGQVYVHRRSATKYREREFFSDNLLVRIHLIIVMIRWTGLAPWEFEFTFPVSSEVIKFSSFHLYQKCPSKTFYGLYNISKVSKTSKLQLQTRPQHLPQSLYRSYKALDHKVEWWHESLRAMNTSPPRR